MSNYSIGTSIPTVVIFSDFSTGISLTFLQVLEASCIYKCGRKYQLIFIRGVMLV